jgi:hypothetical protein
MEMEKKMYYMEHQRRLGAQKVSLSRFQRIPEVNPD